MITTFSQATLVEIRVILGDEVTESAAEHIRAYVLDIDRSAKFEGRHITLRCTDVAFGELREFYMEQVRP